MNSVVFKNTQTGELRICDSIDKVKIITASSEWSTEFPTNLLPAQPKASYEVLANQHRLLLSSIWIPVHASDD